jgi:hypothetical protein
LIPIPANATVHPRLIVPEELAGVFTQQVSQPF